MRQLACVDVVVTQNPHVLRNADAALLKPAHHFQRDGIIKAKHRIHANAFIQQPQQFRPAILHRLMIQHENSFAVNFNSPLLQRTDISLATVHAGAIALACQKGNVAISLIDEMQRGDISAVKIVGFDDWRGHAFHVTVAKHKRNVRTAQAAVQADVLRHVTGNGRNDQEAVDPRQNQPFNILRLFFRVALRIAQDHVGVSLLGGAFNAAGQPRIDGLGNVRHDQAPVFLVDRYAIQLPRHIRSAAKPGFQHAFFR